VLKKILLGLETGIDGGSISVFEEGILIDSVNGTGNISKSEDILLLLDILFEKNSLSKSDISLINISQEPGSLTGLRIGLATAKGLSDGLSIPVLKVSLLEKMAATSGFLGRVLSAIITQKDVVYFREFFLQMDGLRYSEENLKKADLFEFSALVKGLCSKSEETYFIFNGELAGRSAMQEETAELNKNNRIVIINEPLSDIFGLN
jgi:tRNA threonylcarbamoyladenosine biosynthesis protein TsaB